jgi:aspartate racemase
VPQVTRPRKNTNQPEYGTEVKLAALRRQSQVPYPRIGAHRQFSTAPESCLYRFDFLGLSVMTFSYIHSRHDIVFLQEHLAVRGCEVLYSGCMQATRCLGLIGGLGVGATVHYYGKLAKGCEQHGLTLDIVITNAQTSRVFAFVEAKDRVGLAEYLNGYIRRMKAAGAELAVIPAVTPHYCIDELAATSPLRMVSIFNPLREELARRALRRVAIFGTRFVIESDFFGALPGVEIVRARPDEIDLIHTTYVELAAAGKGSAEKRDKLTSLAKTLIERDRVDAIVLAGTDLTLLFDESTADFPCVDCAGLHIREILKQLGNA